MCMNNQSALAIQRYSYDKVNYKYALQSGAD